MRDDGTRRPERGKPRPGSARWRRRRAPRGGGSPGLRRRGYRRSRARRSGRSVPEETGDARGLPKDGPPGCGPLPAGAAGLAASRSGPCEFPPEPPPSPSGPAPSATRAASRKVGAIATLRGSPSAPSPTPPPCPPGSPPMPASSSLRSPVPPRPMRHRVTGLGQSARRACRAASVRGPGGLETMTMCRVSGSASRASRAMNVPSPPTSSPRSRPPTPIPWEIPPPPRCTSTDSSWRPVPEAAMTPISPRRTRFAKASGTPAMIAVPQSGPITIRPRARASRLRATSSPTGTLSLKTRTWRPAASARLTSRAANGPGTDTIARLAPGSASHAARTPGRRPAALLASEPLAVPSRLVSAASRAAARISPPAARTASTRSSGPAARPSSVSRPASSRIARFDGVPIMSDALSTPSRSESEAEIRMRTTESR